MPPFETATTGLADHKSDAELRADLVERWGMPPGVVARMSEVAIRDAWLSYAEDDVLSEPSAREFELTQPMVLQTEEEERQERRRKRIEANRSQFIVDCLAMEAESADEAGMLGYMARVLVQATMPHSQKKGSNFIRSNGSLTVEIAASSKGLPYGAYPRLLLAWLTTEAVRTQSPTLHLGNSLTSFMAKLGLQSTGGRWGTIPRLRDQADRLFKSHVLAYESIKDGDRTHSRGSSITVADEWDLWWDASVLRNQESLFQSWVKLTEKFYRQVTDRPVPVDLRAIAALKKSPMALDMYAWVTYRMSYLSRRTEIPWQALQLQFGSDYSDTPQGTRDFKRGVLRALRAVTTVYPALRLEESPRSLILLPSPTHIRRIR